ncbi:MAG: M18 family aminopeptidase [Pseudomonadota bacterium]
MDLDPVNEVDFKQGLLGFLSRAVTPFHAVRSLASELEQAGFTNWDGQVPLAPASGGAIFTRGGCIVAVKPGRRPLAEGGLRMVGAHTDSPCLMVKPNPEQEAAGYQQLGVEVYGGALLNPWFDRDLSLAGRVSYLAADGKLATALVDFKDPIAVIPSLAIHLDREANKNRSVNAQTQMPPILGLAGFGQSSLGQAGPESASSDEFSLRRLLTDRLSRDSINVEEVLDYELCFYDTQPPRYVGLHGEFLASARLDNLLSCYIGCRAIAASESDEWQLLICNDHEEVGSLSASGAQGPLLRHLLETLVGKSSFSSVMRRSMMVSTDNAHGVHPNYREKHDAKHGPLLNGGPVIKVNANQRYASSSDGAALFRLIAREVGVTVQSFAMRADMACGSTIGPLTAGELGVTTLDVGVPTFAMHSIRELAGSEDSWSLYNVLRAYFARGSLLPDS